MELPYSRLSGSCRGKFRILGCEGGEAAFTPQNAGLATPIPNEPYSTPFVACF